MLIICQAVNKVQSLPLWANPVFREMASGKNVSSSDLFCEGAREGRGTRYVSEAKSLSGGDS